LKDKVPAWGLLKKMPVNLVFVRHAQGTHNKMANVIGAGAYNDPINLDAELTPLGVSQTLENRLFEKFDAIYCSPLRRCRNTLLGVYPLSESYPVVLDDRLMEQPCGGNICDKRLEKNEILSSFPKTWDHSNVSETYDWALNYDADHAKIASFTEDLKNKHDGQTVLIVSHGTWIYRWFLTMKSIVVNLENCKVARTTI
jgi:broad specificity phosphatase PhoE